MSFIEKRIPIKSIHEYLCQLLQTDPTSKMLKVPLCFGVLSEHFKQSANKLMLFKYNENRA